MYRVLVFATLIALSYAMFPYSVFPPEVFNFFWNETAQEEIFKETSTKETITFEIEGLGDVVGTLGRTLPSSRTIYSFYGLPYGHETSGQNRFKPSKMYETPWFLPKRLVRPLANHACAQNPFVIPFVGRKGTEDCLKLFIHTPNKPGDEGFGSLPVLVWFHGGSFVFGDHNIYRANRYLDAADLVLVVVHYRLGLLGFMCTHTEEAPGNAGLSDQLLALEYVQKYIHNFGGDASKVTIAGESAGGASVSHLMLYDGAQGLFRGVIAQSGSCVDSWTIDKDPVKSALFYGEKMNCSYAEDELDEFVECMRQVPVGDLIRAQTKAFKELRKKHLTPGGVIPVIQKVGSRRIISDIPDAKLRNGNFNKVPTIHGTNLNEGSFVFLALLFEYMREHNVIRDPDFWKYESVHTLLQASGIDDPTDAVTDAMIEKYFPGVEMDSVQNCAAGATDMLGPLFFKSGSHLVNIMVAKYGAPAYCYSFEYDLLGILGESIGINATLHIIGVSHAFELPYFWTFLPLFKDSMKTVSQKMIKLWTNFVIEQNPTPEDQKAKLEEMGIPLWPPYCSDYHPYMRLDTTFEVKEDVTQTWMDMMDRQRQLKNKNNPK